MGRKGSILQDIKMVLRNILGDKKRNFFTCLGIILGVAAVMGMSATFDAMSGIVSSYFEKGGLGNTAVMLMDEEVRPAGITDFDIENIESIDGVSHVGLLSYYDKHSVYLNTREVKNVAVYGRSKVFYEEDTAAKMVCGRSFTESEIKDGGMVCIISKGLAEKVFGKSENAIGRQLQLSGLNYKVIGVEDVVSDSWVRMIFGYMGKRTFTVPYTTLEQVYGIAPRSFVVYLEGKDYQSKLAAHQKAQKYIEDNMHVKMDEGYMIMFGGSILKQFEEDQKKQGQEQSLIAGICMLVGGIGIMNMMFVSVTERTKEIGLRKALGATPERIQLQFLLESVILSLVGGLVGAVIGTIFSLLVSIGMTTMVYLTEPGVGFNLNIKINWLVMFEGLLFSMIVGVVFGWVPARKASKMNPIDALKL